MKLVKNANVQPSDFEKKNRRGKMKKYVTPDATVVLLEQQDICTASSFSNGNASFGDYDYDPNSWI